MGSTLVTISLFYNRLVRLRVQQNLHNSIVVVAILEHQQRGFYITYLEDCDLDFFNLEVTRPKLPFTLIFNYKRSTHVKKRGERSTKDKNRKETKEKQNSRRD